MSDIGRDRRLCRISGTGSPHSAVTRSIASPSDFQLHRRLIHAASQFHFTDAMRDPSATRTALSIAGSDSGGGAGIQADLKSFTAFSVFGTSVLTALTAQNTRGVQAVRPVDPAFVSEQIDSVLGDIGADAVKTGMLFSADIIEAVAEALKRHGVEKLVVDPVMVSSSGHRLLDAGAVGTLAGKVLPLATLITPNTLEAQVLVEHAGKKMEIDSLEAMKEAAKIIRSALNLKGWVLLKGGHLPLDAVEADSSVRVVNLPAPPSQTGTPAKFVVDLLFDGKQFTLYPKPHQNTRNLHGTGCTLSAAITAGLALGKAVPEAVEAALIYLSTAISSNKSFSVGHGPHGPVNHLHSIPEPFPAVAGPSEAQELVDRFIASCPTEWEEFVAHPFVRKIGDGTLPKECFMHYLRQDYVYLTHFARAHALAAYKEHHLSEIVKTADIILTIGRETKLHVEYCKEWGITLKELENTVEAVPNLSYSRFFLEKGISGDRLDLRIALAPCFFGYAEVGKRLLNDPNTVRGSFDVASRLNGNESATYLPCFPQRATRTGTGSKHTAPKDSPAHAAKTPRSFSSCTVSSSPTRTRRGGSSFVPRLGRRLCLKRGFGTWGFTCRTRMLEFTLSMSLYT